MSKRGHAEPSPFSVPLSVIGLQGPILRVVVFGRWAELFQLGLFCSPEDSASARNVVFLGGGPLSGTTLWHITDECYLIVALSGVIVDANPAACRFLNADRIALLGRTLSEVFQFAAPSQPEQSGARDLMFLSTRSAAVRGCLSPRAALAEGRNEVCYRVFPLRTWEASGDSKSQVATISFGPGSSIASHGSAQNLGAAPMPLPYIVVDLEGKIITAEPLGLEQGSGWNLSSAAASGFVKLESLFSPSELESVTEFIRGFHVSSGRRLLQREFQTVSGLWWTLTGVKLSGTVEVVLLIVQDVTQFRRAEDSLFAAEERFALAVSASIDGMWDWKIGAGELYVSGRLCALLGYDRKEFRSFVKDPAALMKIVSEGDRGRFLEALRVHLRERVVLDFEFRAHHKTDGVRWFRLKGQAIWDAKSGRAHRVAGSLSDVTQARALRSEIESKLNSIESEALVLDLDCEGHVVNANPRALQLLGLNLTDVQCTPLSQLVDESDCMSLWRFLKGSREYEDIVFKGEGNSVVVRGIAGPKVDLDGEITGYTFLGIDVTKQRKAESELAAETALRSAVFDSAASVILTTNAEGVISTINSYALSRFGYEEDEVVGQKTPGIFVAAIAAQDGSNVDELDRAQSGGAVGGQPLRRAHGLMSLLEALPPGATLTREVVMQGRDGDSFSALMSAARLHDMNRRHVGYVLVAQDISGLIKMERIKSQLVATVSHELRTPLTAIRGSLRLIDGMLGADIPQQDRLLVAMAARNADRLLYLVGDLLDIQRIESGRTSFDVRDVNMEEMINVAVDSTSAVAAERGVQIRQVMPAEPEFVRGDFDRLVQVMINLISNAIKFSPRDSFVSIILSRVGQDATVSVRDHGPGVPESFRHHIFGKFNQADASDAREKGGSGLGLSIARAIVHQHDGTIGFRNRDDDGGGAEFSFSIPLKEELQITSLLQEQGEPQATILVIEDDPDIAELLSSAIESMGYRSLCAGTIAGAKEILDREFVDAVTLDLVMPDSHGTALIEWMRSSGRCENVPIVVVSGYASSFSSRASDRTRHSVESGSVCAAKSRNTGSEGASENVIAWMEKPVRTQSLAAFLKDALAMRSQRSVLYVGPVEGRTVAFLRGVCSRLASVVAFEQTAGAQSFFARHQCSTVVLVDATSEQESAFAELCERLSKPALIICWHVDSIAPAGSSSPETQHPTEGSDVASVRVQVVHVSGMQWGAAAFFQQWLSQGRAAEAS